MCMYSVTADNSRDAEQGEDLVLTRAPHGISNWLTEAGKSIAPFAYRIRPFWQSSFRINCSSGASFEQALRAISVAIAIF